jgi:hypothetical protein
MSIQIQSSKFFTQLLNGEDFSLNTAEFYGQLTGNVGDLIKTEQTVRVSWTAESDGVNAFEIQPSNNVFRQSGNFLQDEFSVGDSVSFYDMTVPAVPVLIFTRNILSISVDTIVLDGAAFVGELGSYLDAKIFGLTSLDGVRHAYGLIENNEPTNYISKISTGATQLHSASGVTTASPAFVPMIPTPGVQSWIDDGNIQVKFDSTLTIVDDFAQVFVVEHIFRILPYYLDGQFTNLQTLVPPALYASGNSLKYVMDLKFSQTLSSLDTKSVVLDTVNGLTGWFNENAIGFFQNYTLTSITYTDTASAQTVPEIDSQLQTEVTIVINSANATFIASTPFVVLLSYLPPLAQYSNNNNTVKENFLFESIYQVTGAGAKAESIISDLVGTFDNASQITITFKTDYTTAQSLVIGNGDYLIDVTIKAPANLNASENDQVAILCDSNVFDFDPDVENLMFMSEFQFYPHDVNEFDLGFDDYKGWIEDGVFLKTEFSLNTDEPAEVTQLKVHVSAYNSTTGGRFDLDSYNFDLSNSVVIGSTQQINIAATRGFRLKTASQFNKANITTTNTSTVGLINVQEYLLELGFKLNFEEWIAQLDADPIFYDIAQQNDGFNKKLSNYFANGYTPKVIVEAVVEDATDVPTTYTFLSQDLEVYDYDKDGSEPPAWTPNKIELFDINDNPIFEVLNNDFTKVKATFTPETGTPPVVARWAIIRLVQEGGSINTIYELSSMRASATNNPLIPLNGEFFAKITNTGTVIEVECMINPLFLPSPSASYHISGRLSLDNKEPEAKTTEADVIKDTETDDVKTLD